MTTTATSTDRLRVVRGRRVVLPELTCTIQAGRVTGLLGPSGSGKTTLMRAIVGVQLVAGGSITVLDRPAGHPELRRRVAYMTQQASVYRDISVRENVSYFARLAGASATRVGDVIESVGVGDVGPFRIPLFAAGRADRCAATGNRGTAVGPTSAGNPERGAVESMR